MSRAGEIFSRFASEAHFRLHGEDVVYKKITGQTRPIKAIVSREPSERIDANGMAYTPKFVIEVMNDSVNGINSSEVDVEGSQTILIAERIGGTAVEFGIYRPTGPALPSGPNRSWMDEAILTLELK